jgi:kumamolisin
MAWEETMETSNDRIPIPGSEPTHPTGARRLGPADPDETFEVTVRVRPRPSAGGPGQVETMSALPIQERHYPSREEYEAAHGADPAEIATVEAFARKHGLNVTEASPERRTVVLSGTARALSSAFGVTLERYESDGISYRAPSGPVHLPPELAPIVEAVIGFDDRPYARR